MSLLNKGKKKPQQKLSILRIKENIYNPKQSIYQKFTAYVMLNAEKLGVSPSLNWEQDKDVPSYHSYSISYQKAKPISQCYKVRKRNQMHMD